MTATATSPVLADAADVLSDHLRAHLRRLSAVLRPHTHAVERRFEQSLRRMGMDARQRAALAAITPGAVARSLAGSGGDFIEQVEYHGRRLAKLNLPPNQIVAALGEYDALLTPILKRLLPGEYGNFQWVREQLQFVVILTLNNAYYQVREAETQAFYELFRVELESRTLDELLGRFLATLAQFCRAGAAQLYLRDPETGDWQYRGGSDGVMAPRPVPGDRRTWRTLERGRCWSWNRKEGTGGAAILDPAWARRYQSCWSVPLTEGRQLAGVIQFGFSRMYEWLPREQELLAAAAERCLIAAQKARLVDDLARREEQVRSLAEHMLHIEEAERRRISRELHDEAGQSLLTVRLQLEMIENGLPVEAPARTRLGEVREMTERTILEIRRLIAALSPAVLEQLGLSAALRQLVSRFRRVHAAKVRLQMTRLQGLPKKLEIIVYRLLQECCHNIAKHSQASRVNISAAAADGVLRLQVEDDGIGFPPEEAAEKRNSFGIAGIRERVALMGGRFELESWPRVVATASPERQAVTRAGKGPSEGRVKSGTRIRIELPIERGKPRPRPSGRKS